MAGAAPTLKTYPTSIADISLVGLKDEQQTMSFSKTARHKAVHVGRPDFGPVQSEKICNNHHKKRGNLKTLVCNDTASISTHTHTCIWLHMYMYILSHITHAYIIYPTNETPIFRQVFCWVAAHGVVRFVRWSCSNMGYFFHTNLAMLIGKMVLARWFFSFFGVFFLFSSLVG